MSLNAFDARFLMLSAKESPSSDVWPFFYCSRYLPHTPFWPINLMLSILWKFIVCCPRYLTLSCSSLAILLSDILKPVDSQAESRCQLNSRATVECFALRYTFKYNFETVQTLLKKIKQISTAFMKNKVVNK